MMAKYKPESRVRTARGRAALHDRGLRTIRGEGLHFAIKPDSCHVRSYFKHATLLDFFYAESSSTGKLLNVKHMLGTVAYASRPRVQIYSFAYTSRSIHHSHYSYFSYYLVLTPVISLLTKPTPQGSYWLVYCSFVPQHVFLSFLAARSSFS